MLKPPVSEVVVWHALLKGSCSTLSASLCGLPADVPRLSHLEAERVFVVPEVEGVFLSLPASGLQVGGREDDGSLVEDLWGVSSEGCLRRASGRDKPCVSPGPGEACCC